MSGRGTACARWGPRLLWLLAFGYLATISFSLAQFHARASGGLPPTAMEFTPTYAAAMQLQALPAESLYEREPMLAHTREAFRAMYPEVHPIWLDQVRYAPWLYPPHFILLVAPLALLPYWWAYAAWVGASAMPYLAAMRRILPARLAWPAALAAPPVFYNALQGQTGFLTAGFIGLGLALLRARPVLAGVAIGLASVKPHLGLLIPVALLAGSHWHAAAAAAVTVLALVAFSVVAMGTAPWVAFLCGALGNLQGFEASVYKFVPMTSILSLLAMAGVDLGHARAWQYAALLVSMALVAWVWWRGQARPATHGLQAAILCLAAPLAVPMAYIYDLVLIVPAVAWIGLDLRARGAGRTQWTLLVGATASLLAVVSVADALGVQIGPFALAVLLALALRRYALALYAEGAGERTACGPAREAAPAR